MGYSTHLPSAHFVYEPLLSGRLEYPAWLLERPTSALRLELPHVPLKKSKFWVLINEMHTKDMSDHWCHVYLPSLAAEIRGACKYDDDKSIHDLPRCLVEQHGELAVRVIKRAWDLHIALTTLPETPGFEATTITKDEFVLTLKDAALRFFYITLFKNQLSLALFHWKQQAEKCERYQAKDRHFVTDVLARSHDDAMLRLKGEFLIINFLRDATSAKSPDVTVDERRMGDVEAATACFTETVAKFYRAYNPGKDVDDEVCQKHELILCGVATRMVMNWEKFTSAKRPTVEEVIKILCRIMLTALEDVEEEEEETDASSSASEEVYNEGELVVFENKIE